MDPTLRDTYEAPMDVKVERPSLELGDPAGKVDDNPHYVRPADLHVRYAVLERPAYWECAVLGFQHYLTMLGSTVLIPFLLVPAMGGTPGDLARVIGCIFFVSGLITMLQTLIGDRLPIIQGGSFAYLVPAFSIIAQVKANNTFPTEHDRFVYTMRELQGGIIGSAVFVVLIGSSGLLNWLLRFISPITVAANICIVGLSLYGAGFAGVGNCMQLGLPLIVAIIFFSQYLRKYYVPLGSYKWRVFELFPIILAIAVVWIYGIIMTEAGVYDNSSPNIQAACRTDQSSVLKDSPWFRMPYPGQWGTIIWSWSSTFTMLAGALSAMVESLGDYYAAARISGAPVPPPAVLARAVTLQGFSCMLAGLFGTANGTTAYNENIGALQLTGVGSRFVVQCGACIIMVMAVIGKFGGLFASMPQAMVSGLFCVMFALIAGVGLAQMQYTDQNSSRNIFILGFGLYMGLSVPYYFSTYTTANSHGPVQSGNYAIDDIFNAIFSTGAAVTLIVTLFLDNTIPGTIKERGLHVWLQASGSMDWWEVNALHDVYGLPFNFSRIYQRNFGVPVRNAFKKLLAPLSPACTPVGKVIHTVMTCGGCCGPVPEGKEQDKNDN